MKAATRQSIPLLLGVTLLILSTALLAQATDLKIGYVDMKRLLDQAPQVQQAHDRLQSEFAERSQELEVQQGKLDAMRASLEADRNSLDSASIADRQSRIDVLAGSVRRARQRLQDELKQRSSQELDRSWQEVSNAAVRYARNHGYDLLLPSPVIYASSAADITDEILQQLRRDARTTGNDQ